ncbi:Uma2 family endonuclease [Streptomyces sp. NPDC091292]|uniref:Uma2 family endonuclease n=1 Tax=Streptomyces sp. NPDC091292 TaxID=3365991 RepID=UPI0038156C9D
MSEAAYEHLLRYAHLLNVPAGLGPVEISDGQIVMAVSPSTRHELAARRLRRQLDPQVPVTDPGFIAENGPEVEDPRLGVLRRPDLVVVREEALDAPTAGVDPAEVLLAAEIVSPSNPDNDYVAKMRDYPAMGIGHYLIIDPRTGLVHHHTEPTGRSRDTARYTSSREYPFGARIQVGDWQIDTSVFPRYEAGESDRRSDPAT